MVLEEMKKDEMTWNETT